MIPRRPHPRHAHPRHRYPARPHPRHLHRGARPAPPAKASSRDEAERRFFSATSIDPSPRIHLEAGSSELDMRAMDLLCPIGRGQRGLIVAPPGSGKTTILKHLCEAISTAEPTIKIYCLLVDERPEEATDFRRSAKADVRWSSLDQPYEHHVSTANQLMKEAYREVDSGKDVFILIDSLTRLARVHNVETRGQGRTLSGGVDARALEVPRRIFGSARKLEGGGSLGILATILINTDSLMDEVIFQEFKGTGNMEMVLSREISNRRVYPAIHVAKTGTRKEELLLEPHELKALRKLRAGMANLKEVDAAQMLVGLLAKYPTNRELLAACSKP